MTPAVMPNLYQNNLLNRMRPVAMPPRNIMAQPMPMQPAPVGQPPQMVGPPATMPPHPVAGGPIQAINPGMGAMPGQTPPLAQPPQQIMPGGVMQQQPNYNALLMRMQQMQQRPGMMSTQ
jgi:hypothetical protein